MTQSALASPLIATVYFAVVLAECGGKKAAMATCARLREAAAD
jgi:hypothetical protein